MRTRHVIASMAVHSLLFLPLIFNVLTNGGGNSQEKQEGQNKGSKADNKEILEKQDGVDKYKHEVMQVQIVDSGVLKKEKPKNPGTDRECPNPKAWYGGIGITSTEVSSGMTVLKVHKGYPAQKAGLMVGDVIFTHNSEIRGEPGTTALLSIMRGGRTLTLEIVREKICLDD